MKTPEHWSKINLISIILSPLGLIYSLVTFLKIKLSRPYKASVPVICIGNLTAGGVGKTPVVIDFALKLKKQGKNPFILSRGYKGKLKNIIVDYKKHNATDVGDEPLMMSKYANVIVSPNRKIGAKLAIENGADIIIMDDGFQNTGLYKDKSYIVVDGRNGFGNKLSIPAGPLRESISSGMKRADEIIILGQDKCKISKLARKYQKPVIRGQFESVRPFVKLSKAIAFAAIGNPDKFFHSLKQSGIKIIKKFYFADHHSYTHKEIQDIIDLSNENRCNIFTTEKDMVKISDEQKRFIKVLKIKPEWQNNKKIYNDLRNVWQR